MTDKEKKKRTEGNRRGVKSGGRRVQEE